MDLLESAQRAAKLAAAYLRTAVPPSPEAWTAKGQNDFVTEVDRHAEEIIRGSLLIDTPNARVIGEELGSEIVTGGLVWIVDPLDGTTNFAHGFPFYSVSIGLEYGGECILGVVLDPLHHELFTAELGIGASLNGDRIRVSTTTTLDKSLLVTGFAYNIRETPNNNLDHFSRISLCAQGVRRTGSAALDLCYVACGRFDGYWEVKLNPWDMAAGIVILREAGGVVSSFTKGEFSLYGQELVATNGHIHDHLLGALQQPPDDR